MYICVQVPQRQDEGIRSPRAGIKSGYELIQVLGTKGYM